MTKDNDDEVKQLATAIESLVQTAQNDSIILKKQQEFQETINALNAQIAKMNELLETQLVTNNQEKSNLTDGFPSLQQFEVMISGIGVGSFTFSKYGALEDEQNSSDLVMHILKRFSVGLGFILPTESAYYTIDDNEFRYSRTQFVDKLLMHLHRVLGKKTRLVKDSDFVTIYYS